MLHGKIKKNTFCLVLFCTAFLVGMPPYALAKNTAKKDLGNIAIIVRGGRHVAYTFHQTKKKVWGGALGGAIGGAVGGLVSSAMAAPSKAAEKDLQKEEEINSLLGDWTYIHPFLEGFQDKLSSRHKIEKIFIVPED